MATEHSEKEAREDELTRLKLAQLDQELIACRNREEGYLEALKKKQILLDQLEPERNALRAEVERLRNPNPAELGEHNRKGKH